MKIVQRWVVLSFFVISNSFFVPTCFAGVGADAADFLRITPDSHVAALGNSGVANGDTDFSLYHNPALLSQTKNRYRLAGAQTQWLLGLQASHYTASLAWSFRGGNPWGMGVFVSEWHKSFNATDPFGNPAGRGDYRARNAGIALSHAVLPTFSLGVTVKRLSQSFGEQGFSSQRNRISASLPAWDAGVAWRTPWKDVVMAAAYRNVGSKTSFGRQEERLPTSAHAGAQGRFLGEGFSWSLEAMGNREKAKALGGGLGFSPFPGFTLRAGYNTLYNGKDYGGFTSGLGFYFKSFRLDCSFVPLGPLGSVQRFSMSWRS